MSFIDDMSMATYGEAPALYEVHAHMGAYLIKGLRKRKGKISKKTTIVGSKFNHKLILQAKYKKLGVQAKIGLAAKDLGLGRTGGLRRTMIGIKDRFGTARLRANKVAYLSRKQKSKSTTWHRSIAISKIWGRSGWLLPQYDKAAKNDGCRLYGVCQIWKMPNNSNTDCKRPRVGPRGQGAHKAHHGMV